MRDSDLGHLLELFGREQACYTALLDLARRQRLLIESGETARIAEVLDQKNRLLERADAVEASLAPYKDRWPLLRREFDADDRQILDMALATVAELLTELIAEERMCEQLLKRRTGGRQAA